MDKRTIVLPSARAVRHEQLSLNSQSTFLPNYITMSDFISKLCIVDGYKYIDDDTRVLLLLEASDFKKFSELQIERSFFTFTKNSAYIFKFFAELSAEKYDINNLLGADIYGEYEEHISILIELHKRYEKLCEEKRYLDRIFLPKLYTFNKAYAKKHEKITLSIDGHLTNFEFELLEELTHYSEVELLFNTSSFNTKMQSRFYELGLEVKNNYRYKISLNEQKILSQETIEQNDNVVCESFSESLLQIAFIKKKIYEYVEKGYAPDKIAVILPNESMAPLLRSFDSKSNLNLAMGEPYSESWIYRKIEATIKMIELDSCENEARVERIGDELYLKLYAIYYKSADEIDFIEFLTELKVLFSKKQELKIYEEEIFSFKKIIHFMKDMSVKSLLNLFMQRLSARTLDDIRGGKVTVMGVLESRSIEFDGVIIIDFDDKNVPKRSDKDMFLNSQLRENANLPTMNDRENLQKHYYTSLINSSKEVAISFVSSQESSASRFLKQLAIVQEIKYDESEYAKILFSMERKDKLEFQDKKIEYSFKNVKLSASRLKVFLTCKRKYYYKYIEFIQGHTIPKDVPEEYEIGNAVHLALKELYLKKSTYSDVKSLKKDLDRELDKVCGKSELEKYLISLQKKRLSLFAQNEILRFRDGWEVYKCEEKFEIDFQGIKLIGQIDRVDKKENLVEVLDYKTGSYKLYNKNNYTEATDFQLEFYYLLASGLGDVQECSFYDLKESKIVRESFLEEKLAILSSHIKDLLAIEEIDTTQCEDVNECKFCDYKVMCQRES